ncbi:MAG TPA: hypothetical protein VLE23_16645 [Geminicoccaceae bacterium]|nr:hypothetical protein [Geminicoccaceae bacterium]
MSALMDCVRAGMLTLAILATTAAGLAGVALWPADAAHSEARVWIRSGESGCRYVPASEAAGALPCQA